MKQIKKYILIVLGLISVTSARAQLFADLHAGLSTTMIISNQFTSSPGIGICLGSTRLTRVGYRFEVLNEYSFYYNTFGIKGYKLTGFDSVGKPKYNIMTNNFNKIGVNYCIGANFYIIPYTLSVNAALFVAENFYYTGDNSDNNLGTPPVDPAIPAPTVGNIESIWSNSGGLDYGFRVGAAYNLKKIRLSLTYFNGFSNLGASYPGLNATSSDIQVSCHYYLRWFSIARAYQNKLVK